VIVVKCPRCIVGRLKDDGTTFRCACGYSYTPPRKAGAKQRFSLLCALALGACAEKAELPPIPPPADMCALYSSYRYSPAAAAVENPDALDKHNANERVFYDRCIANHPALDPKRSGGPR